MPRVTQQHLDARRRQILHGAARCFARDGFHATTMADVLRECGLSAGAVYRYFPGKDAIVAAIASEALTAVREAFAVLAEADPPPSPHEIFTPVIQHVGGVLGLDEGQDADRALAQLLLQIWGETPRNPTLHSLVTEAFGALRAHWADLVTSYQARGWLDADVPAEHVARTLIATVQGHFVQQALFGDMPAADFRSGLRALTTMRRPPG